MPSPGAAVKLREAVRRWGEGQAAIDIVRDVAKREFHAALQELGGLRGAIKWHLTQSGEPAETANAKGEAVLAELNRMRGRAINRSVEEVAAASARWPPEAPPSADELCLLISRGVDRVRVAWLLDQLSYALGPSVVRHGKRGRVPEEVAAILIDRIHNDGMLYLAEINRALVRLKLASAARAKVEDGSDLIALSAANHVLAQLKAGEQLPKFVNDDGSYNYDLFFGWIRAIARNRTINRLRKISKEPRDQDVANHATIAAGSVKKRSRRDWSNMDAASLAYVIAKYGKSLTAGERAAMEARITGDPGADAGLAAMRTNLSRAAYRLERAVLKANHGHLVTHADPTTLKVVDAISACGSLTRAAAVKRVAVELELTEEAVKERWAAALRIMVEADPELQNLADGAP